MNDELRFVISKAISIRQVCSIRLSIARALLEASLLCYETNSKPYWREYSFYSIYIYIYFNVIMSLNNVCNIPFVFICVPFHAFSSNDVPMISLLVYFVRNDKNKDDQSILCLMVNRGRRPASSAAMILTQLTHSILGTVRVKKSIFVG